MKICALDPGIVNLGICQVEVDDKTTWDIIDVPLATVIDLTNTRCSVECKLQHSGHIVDRVLHFLQNYGHVFTESDLILAEQQPPGSGGESVGALLYSMWRSKMRLVHPGTIQKHFGLPKGNYDLKKQKALEIVDEHLRGQSRYDNHVRQHDMADAFLLIMHHVAKEKQKMKKSVKKPPIDLSTFVYQMAGSFKYNHL
jgi:hypothetical protein